MSKVHSTNVGVDVDSSDEVIVDLGSSVPPQAANSLMRQTSLLFEHLDMVPSPNNYLGKII